MHNRSVVIIDGSLLSRAKDMQLGLLKALPLSGEVCAELQTTILCSDFIKFFPRTFKLLEVRLTHFGFKEAVEVVRQLCFDDALPWSFAATSGESVYGV